MDINTCFHWIMDLLGTDDYSSHDADIFPTGNHHFGQGLGNGGAWWVSGGWKGGVKNKM